MKKIYTVLSVLFTLCGAIQVKGQSIIPGDPGNFISTWQTDNDGTSDDDQITIPTYSGGFYSYNYNIYWEKTDDASISGVETGVTGSITLTFPSPGTYRVEINGDFPRIYFNNGGDKDKILTVDQWGNIQWKNMRNAFYGAKNMQLTTTVAPDLSQVSDMSWMFAYTETFDQDLSSWDVSKVNSMSSMFRGAIAFNSPLNDWTPGVDLADGCNLYAMFRDTEAFDQDLSSWDVSKVNDMGSMFYGAKAFNGSLEGWEPGSALSNGASLYDMFRDAEVFNQDLSSWDVTKVNDMGSMFYGAKAFNGPLVGWKPGIDLANGCSLYAMFRDTETFNQDLSSWDVSKVNNMNSMFSGAQAFNGPLVGWKPGIDLADGCNLYAMFRDTETFNQDLSSWDVSKVSGMSSMFYGAKAFNGPLVGWKPGIDLADGCYLSFMFYNTDVFNQDLSSWNVSKVSSMSSMFSGAQAFNSPLIGWKPGIDLADGCSLYAMFRDTETFNQDLSSWDVSKVSGMSSMFSGAQAFNSPLIGWKPGIDLADGCSLYAMFRDTETFNQDLSSWDISSVTNMSSMFSNSTLSIANYDATLIGWAAQSDIPQNLILGAHGLKYCQSQAARQSLIDDHGWTISGDTEECFTFTPSTDNILYVNQSVDQSATGYTGSGDSWANAIPELADALHWAREQHDADNEWLQNDSLRIYVAKGKYLPKYKLAEQDNDNIPTTDRDKSFLMVKNVQLYGGFPDSGNSDFADRDWESYETILSGDLGTPGDDSDNAYHVVVSVGEVGNALLDGFSIQDGNADRFNKLKVYGVNIERRSGGGIYNHGSSPELKKLKIIKNNSRESGGGIYNLFSSPVLVHVEIIENSARYNGGGVYSRLSSPSFINTVIKFNVSERGGGGIYNYDAFPEIRNSLITDNYAEERGGGIYNQQYADFDLKMKLINVTIANNHATQGGGIYNYQTSPELINSLVFGNGENVYNYPNTSEPAIPVFKNSLIEGSGGSDSWDTTFGTDGSNNIDGDPLFTDPANGDYSLQACSPAVNAGSNSHYAGLGGDTKDLAGNPRVYDYDNGGIIDMGAFEFQGEQVDYDNVVFEDTEVTYDGEVHTITVTNLPTNITASYEVKNAVGDVVTEAVHAGVYTFTATLSGCGPDKTLTATLTIEKAALMVVADDDQSKVYGDADPVLTYAVSGFQGSDDGSILTGSLDRTAGEDVGTYPIDQGDLSAGANYDIDFTGTDFKIIKATLTVIADDNQSKVYGEVDPVLTYTVSGFQGSDDETVLTGSLSRTAGENVGSYPIDQGDLSAGTNYEIDFIGADFAITKATITGITFENASFTYDGTSKSLVIAGTLPTGTSVTYTNNDQTDAGSYTVAAEIDGGTNYEDLTLTAELTIEKASIAGITLDDAGFTYDSTAKSLMIAGTLPTGTSVSYTGNDQTDAGSYTVTAEIDGGNNYEDLTLTAELTIEKATITGITFENASFTYDGTAKSLAIAGTLPTGTSVTYTNNDQRDAGSYTVTAEIDGGSNYEDLTLTAELTISKASITGINLDDVTFIYDGTAKSLMIAGTLPTGASVSYTGNDQTDAGSYTVTAEIDGGTNYEDLTLTAELTIEKATIRGITFENASFTYDGTSKSLVIAGTLPTGTSVTYTNNDQTDAGSYTVTAEIDGGNNYEDLTLTAELTIEKSPITGITFDDAGFTYDGTAKSLMIAGTLPTGTSVTYTNNDQTDAGSYTVTAEIGGGNNYEELILTATLTIEKASITGITLDDANFTYDGTAKSLAITGTLPAGASVSYTNNIHSDAGEYRVVAEVDGGINFESFTLSALLTINKDNLLHITFEDGVFSYDGSAHSLFVEGTLPQGVEIAYLDNDQIDAGIYTVTAEIDGGTNYEDLILTAELTIEKAASELYFAEIAPVGRDAGKVHLDVQSNNPAPIRLYSDNELVGVISGDQEVEIRGVGVTTIRAEQDGDANHLPAEAVSRELRVQPDANAKLPVRVHPALSPNGDGVNDFLRIEGIEEYPDNMLRLFNSNGHVFYEGRGYNNGSVRFEGSTAGGQLAEGTYYYVLELKVDGRYIYDKGFFVVRY